MIEQSIRIGTQSITLDGEYKSTWPNAWAFYHIKNIGESDALVSTVEGLEGLVAPTEEIPSDVIVIPAGASLTVPGRHSAVLLTSGKVQVIANNNPNCPFKVAQVDNKVEQPGHIIIFSGNSYCPGWEYTVTPSDTSNDAFVRLQDATYTLSLSGICPKEFYNLTILYDAYSGVSGTMAIEIYGSDESLIASRSLNVAGMRGIGLASSGYSFKSDELALMKGAPITIRMYGAVNLKIPCIYFRTV